MLVAENPARRSHDGGRRHLRSLAAEALLWAPHRPLFPVSLGLMAVANAFVMLGLLPEPRADAVLVDHKSALESMGLGNTWGVTKGELTVRPGAHGYWQSRMAGPGGLREVPLLVAAAGVYCPTSVAEVCFEWVKLTSMGWQLSFRATAPDRARFPAITCALQLIAGIPASRPGRRAVSTVRRMPGSGRPAS
jgi:hypothetical protein